MSWNPNTPNTGDALAAMSPESVRILWEKTVEVFEQTEDFFMRFEGGSKDSPIRVINDTAVGAGLKFRITSRAGYYNKGKSGDALFTDVTDFAQDVINNNEVDADYLRNASSSTSRTDEFMGTKNEIANGQAEELGKWMGREKSARMGMTFRLKGGPENLLIGGNKTDESQLKTADGLVFNDILYMGQALKPMGGRPCEVATIRGNKVMKYCVVGTVPGLFTLKADSDYKDVLKHSAPRESAYEENPLYAGGYVDIDGHRINEFNPIDPDGYAWSGSFFNPKAFLGGAIAAGTAAFDILGGGSAAAAATTNIEFFRFFPNFAFEFLPNDIFVPGVTQKYLLIVNPKNAAIDPGKVGMYGFTTGNIGTKITINLRLSPVINGPVAETTVGNVVWNTGVWAGIHTQTHPIGATIVECNANGVPIGDTLMFGANAAMRGYGQFRNKRTQWAVDGDFEMRRYITTVFGQALRKNVNLKNPGFVRMRHALSYPELNLPVVP